ncbi:MAG: hypothetical protein ABMA00_03725 [Gemmatimonas sp.]
MPSLPTAHILPRLSTLAVLFAVLLAARLLGAHFMYFYQGDEVSLAAGVSALVSHNELANIYRYGPQVGYYRLVQLIDVVIGGSPRWIPHIMITLSALTGAIIPVCGLALFPSILSRAERWVLVGLLAANPILWMSSTYGSSTMPATALLVMAVTVLSLRPARAPEIAALAMFGAGVLVRADTILAAPVIGLLLWQRYDDMRAVAIRVTPLALVIGGIYLALATTDPRMASSAEDVARHLTNPTPTKFWEYLLWSTSPFVFICAIVGVTDLASVRRHLLWTMAVWCLPFFAFYYGATTSPRYFIPTVVPVAICGAVGALMLARVLAPHRTRAARVVIGALCAAPLFVGLGWFSSSSPKNLLTESQFETHVGPMWTGAFLYKTYFTPGILVRSVRNTGFGRSSHTEYALDSSLAAVASGALRQHTIVVLMGGWNGHVFHYYANVHGARYTSQLPGPNSNSEAWMDLGGARLMSIRRDEPRYLERATLPVAADDQIWIIAWTAEAELNVRSKVPVGLALSLVNGADRPVRQYTLRAAQ